MNKFQVIVDSTSDIEKKYRDEFGVDYVKMVFTVDGKTYDANLDWAEISPKEYYGLMRNGKRSITGLVKTEEFEQKFEEYLAKGQDVLYISCSSKLSGSLNSGKIIASEINEKYKNNKIVCFDSLRSCYAQGAMAMAAAKLANEGKSVDEAAEYLLENRLKFQTYATVGSLEWLKKAGRVKASAAFFGNLIGVKPIILGDANGNNYAYKKVKGRKVSLDELVQTVIDRMEDQKKGTLYIEHADCEEDANYVKEQILAKTPIKNINISSVGPIIGATVGPDTIIVDFYGEKVTVADPEGK